MDFNLKQWRSIKLEQQEEHELPKLDLLTNSHNYQHNPSDSSTSSSALPLFVAQPITNLSAPYSSSEHPNAPSATNKFPRMGSYFSLAQWQELELQALIYRHMIAGAVVPTELLHLVKKSIISSNPPPYHLSHPLNQYYPQYQPTLVQSGYWGRGVMDPEPGRCRRTDGKKWRCSRDVVAGQKYCERHVHRGRNRSRKPVEIPTSATTAAAAAATPYGGVASESRKTFTTNTHTQGMVAGSSGGVPHFTLSGPSPSMDLLQLNRRPCDSIIETKGPFEVMNNDGQHGGGARTLHFFDDWPNSLHETDRSTNLSISMPENPSSDFSLKLGTGIEDESSAQGVSGEGDRPWGGTWGTNNMVAPMGGPLAEALRSSTSNSSSPTSVLHRLRGSTSEASYISS